MLDTVDGLLDMLAGVGPLAGLAVVAVVGLVAVTRLIRRPVPIERIVWQPCPLMNAAERAVFADLRAVVDGTQHHVFVQVSLGELGRPAAGQTGWRAAFNTINAKRCDFLVAGADGSVRCAVEYHGKGHFRGDWRRRDAVKRAFFAGIGVPLVVVPARGLSAGQAAAIRGHLATGGSAQV